MPYNTHNETAQITKWMEGCVKSVMNKSGKDKSSAIAICKSQLEKIREKSSLKNAIQRKNK